MVTLEAKSIAAVRETLLKGNAETLISFWKRAVHVKGGNEDVVFEEMLCRDVIAYTLLHYINITKNCYVFGGFVRSHYSGSPWSDIDIMLTGKKPIAPNVFITSAIEFIVMILPISKHNIRYRKYNSATVYGSTYEIKVLVDSHQIIIKLDITNEITLCNLVGDMLPVSIGSCLKMDNGETSFRMSNQELIERISHWKVFEIIDLLRNGSDVKLCRNKKMASSLRCENYREYYWYRIAKLSKHYTLFSADGKEPDKFTEDQLVLVTRRFCEMAVKKAEI